MKLHHLLQVLPTLVASVFSTSIIVPLYIYPDTNAVAWDPLFTAVQNNPNTQFIVVVNPDSGPGSGTFPDSNYIDGVDRLNRLPNVLNIGYVHTLYGAEPESAVQANISLYAGWSKYTDTTKNISISGIFVDETNTTDSDTPFNYYSEISSFVKSTFTSTSKTVVLNPGTKPGADRFYTICDQLIAYECTYGISQFCPTGYQDTTTLDQVTSPGFVAKASVIVNQFDGSTTTLQKLVDDARTYGIGSIYFADDSFYSNLDLVGSQAAALNS